MLAVQASVCAPAEEHSAGRVGEIVHCVYHRANVVCVCVCVCVSLSLSLSLSLSVCVCVSDVANLLDQQNRVSNAFHVMEGVGVSGRD